MQKFGPNLMSLFISFFPPKVLCSVVDLTFEIFNSNSNSKAIMDAASVMHSDKSSSS